ncbi:DUF1690 domain protein [Fusarium sp. NRRL 25303]|nr:DUF1690 domain protein [Fusarium sp. NRRL 25303]
MRGICHAMNHNHDGSSHAPFTKTSQLQASSPRLARQIANADQKPQSTRYSKMLPANIIAKAPRAGAIWIPEMEISRSLEEIVLNLMLALILDSYQPVKPRPHSRSSQPQIAAPRRTRMPEISRKAITVVQPLRSTQWVPASRNQSPHMCGRLTNSLPINSSAPNGLSQDLVDSLQSSNETDASRSKIVELQIQARVAEELKKLQQKEAEALKIAHEKLASADFKDDNSTSQYTVSKEIEAMREKLESRKQVRPLPESVEGARNEVIRCLREHDRRPLDCWQEVENFKAEVKKLEKSWVEKVVS